MTVVSPEQQINEYANSMFRFERLSDRWIASCARYLSSLFGEELRGKTVIDYAFGRGNWSLAFLLAGANKVIAIDASSDNVARLENYCRKRNITNIEILAGNVLREELSAKGDLIWLYGILPLIDDQEFFLNRVRTLAADAHALLYVYQYNANSLREFTVETCRSLVTYQTEAEFLTDSLLFVRPARMRARDDLTAPNARFSTAADLATLLRRCGFYPKRQDTDFQFFLHGKETEDFCPHQFLCSLQSADEVAIREPVIPYAREVKVLREIAQAVFSLKLTDSERKYLAVGLFNTHFAFLKEGAEARDAVIEVFLFLMNILLQKAGEPSNLSGRVLQYCDLLRAALAGEERSKKLSLVSKETDDNLLTEYLLEHNVRI